jgi:hypothetical protein
MRWETERAKGFSRFLMLKGVVVFGGLMYAFVSAMFYFEQWGSLPLQLNTGGGPLLGLTAFVLMGLAWGFLTWTTAELVYASHRKSPIRF